MLGSRARLSSLGWLPTAEWQDGMSAEIDRA